MRVKEKEETLFNFNTEDSSLDSSGSLLSLFQTHAGEHGGSVQLKQYDKKTGNLADPGKAQVDKLDYEFRRAQIARRLKVLKPEEKKTWALFCKERGNQLFAEKKFQEAISFYLDSLLGLGYASTDTEKQEEVEKITIPILLNLAASFVQLQKWKKVVSLCSEIIKLDETNFKAYLRRGKSYTELGQFSKAKQDLGRASKFGCANKEIRDLHIACRKERGRRLKEKKNFQKMLQNNGSPNVSTLSGNDKVGKHHTSSNSYSQSDQRLGSMSKYVQIMYEAESKS